MIRRANPSDLDALWRIYSERYDSDDASPIRYAKEDWLWYLNRNKSRRRRWDKVDYQRGSTIILVMEVNGEIVGLSFSYDMGLWGYLEHIVVSQEHRGKGYANKLIERTFAIGKLLGWHLFESCYYEEIGDMKNFFQKSGWEDGGITTRWVYKENTES